MQVGEKSFGEALKEISFLVVFREVVSRVIRALAIRSIVREWPSAPSRVACPLSPPT